MDIFLEIRCCQLAYRRCYAHRTLRIDIICSMNFHLLFLGVLFAAFILCIKNNKPLIILYLLYNFLTNYLITYSRK